MGSAERGDQRVAHVEFKDRLRAGPERELERLLARHKGEGGSKPILELNMRHPLVAALGTAHNQSRAEDANDLAALLFEEACILDGDVPEDPAAFATRLNRLVVRGLAAS